MGWTAIQIQDGQTVCVGRNLGLEVRLAWRGCDRLAKRIGVDGCVALERHRLNDGAHALGDLEPHAHRRHAGLGRAALDLRGHLYGRESALAVQALDSGDIGAHGRFGERLSGSGLNEQREIA